MRDLEKEELKAIRDNAPEGASHIDDIGDYIKVSSASFIEYFDVADGWIEVHEPYFTITRSLSDINRIIEQREMIEIAWSAIQEAGYEDFCTQLRDYIEGDL